jgi:hypothetical protein
MNPAELKLRDIHLPPEPSWWPPAPGWWVVAALLLVLLALLWRAVARARARQRRAVAIEAELAHALEAPDPSTQLGQLSVLLRRAARHCEPASALLQGEDWLRFLDGDCADRPFSEGAGRILLDGPFKAGIDHPQIGALLPPLRARYRQLLAADR